MVRAFDTFSLNFHSLFSTIRAHVAPTLRYAHGKIIYSVDMLYNMYLFGEKNAKITLFFDTMPLLFPGLL